ncbi:MAG: hypothetical protein SOR89_02700 [Ndongobacter sp.]|nr:hypothetical protein [Ndongobacter sp.]
MNKRYWAWLSMRRLVHSLSFWGLALAVVGIAVWSGLRPNSAPLHIPLYFEEEAFVPQALWDTAGTKPFTFESVSDAEELYHRVVSGEAECGFVFPKDWYDRLLAGRTTEAIQQISLRGDSDIALIAQECIFSKAFSYAAADFSVQYVQEHASQFEDAGRDVPTESEIQKKFQGLRQEDDFSFSGTAQEHPEEPSMMVREELLFPLRGILVLVALIGSLISAWGAKLDEEDGAMAVFSASERREMGLISISVGTLGYVVLLIAGLLLSGWMGRDGLRGSDLWALPALWLQISAFSFLLWRAFRGSRSFSFGMIAIVLMGLVVLPIWVDLSFLFPSLRLLQELFPGGWYLLRF